MAKVSAKRQITLPFVQYEIAHIQAVRGNVESFVYR